MVRKTLCHGTPLLAVERAPDPLVQLFYQYDNRLRVTLDYDLAFYDQIGKQIISTSFPFRMPDMFVVEMKGLEICQQEVKEQLYPFAPRTGPCLKYVHGCCQLGLASSRNYP